MQQRLGPQTLQIAEDPAEIIFAVDFGRRMAGVEAADQHVLARRGTFSAWMAESSSASSARSGPAWRRSNGTPPGRA